MRFYYHGIKLDIVQEITRMACIVVFCREATKMCGTTIGTD